jgi:hypothetical protein
MERLYFGTLTGKIANGTGDRDFIMNTRSHSQTAITSILKGSNNQPETMADG